MRGALRNIEQYSHREESHYHGRASVTHEGKSHSRDREERSVHHDINESLDGNPGANPSGEQHTEFIWRMVSDLEAAIRDGRVQQHDQGHAHETEFFRRCSENKIVHGLR